MESSGSRHQCRNFLIVFGLFAGFTSGLSHFKFLVDLRKKPIPPQMYLKQHVESMIGAGIALHTAFLAGGAATRFFPSLAERTGIWLWFLPTVVGAVFQTILGARFSAKPTP